MKRPVFHLLIGLALILLACGCATVNTLDETRSKEPSRVELAVFNHTADKVYEAAKKACTDLKLHIYHEDRQEGKIYAWSHLRWSSLLLIQLGYGEKVGVYVTPLDASKTKVEVVVQKRFLADAGFSDWRKKILAVIEGNLK